MSGVYFFSLKLIKLHSQLFYFCHIILVNVVILYDKFKFKYSLSLKKKKFVFIYKMNSKLLEISIF